MSTWTLKDMIPAHTHRPELSYKTYTRVFYKKQETYGEVFVKGLKSFSRLQNPFFVS